MSGQQQGSSAAPDPQLPAPEQKALAQAAAPPSPERSPRGGRPRFFALFPSIMLPMFLAVVDQTIVATALPAIAASTGNVERASWIVVAYLISSTIAAPIYGKLGDTLGRRRLLFVALGVFIVASIACAASTTIELLTLSRVLQGLGGGGLMTLSQALVGEAIPPRNAPAIRAISPRSAVSANTWPGGRRIFDAAFRLAIDFSDQRPDRSARASV